MTSCFNYMQTAISRDIKPAGRFAALPLQVFDFSFLKTKAFSNSGNAGLGWYLHCTVCNPFTMIG